MPNSLQPLTVGSTFVIDDRSYRIRHFIDLSTLLAEADDGQLTRLSVQEILQAMAPSEEQATEPLLSSGFEQLSPLAWETAQHRASVLAPLLAEAMPTRTMAEDAAAQLGVHVSTVYRWAKRLKATGSLVELAPRTPSGGRGQSRIDPIVEAVIAETIKERFLTSQRLKPSRLMRDIWMRCKRLDVKPPHSNTVRRRIAALAEKDLLRTRHGRKASADRFDARPGKFPGGEWPNAVWQIDHTPLDLVLVDDVHRRHIGRPWLTVAIDVYSRCIAGFYLSLDPPSEVAVGMCLVNAMLPKEGWLAALGITTAWPVYGCPSAVHADNGKEFRGSMITRAAEEYGFRMEWRKVKTPHWGAHIERLLGTFNEEVHGVPGTTFSNPGQRGQYKPHEEAVLTFGECERYLAEYVTGLYHTSKHSSLERPPIRQYEIGLLGDGLTPGRGLPAPIQNPKRLRLDFLPLIERTVQPYGIRLDGITYYDPVLEPWIRRTDAKTGRPRRFIVRRDPRDISMLYFLDPDTRQYYQVPYRHLEWPSISVWELREVKSQLRKEGREEVDEAVIFETYERLNRLVEQAQAHTVSARKAAQKKRERKRKDALERAQIGKPVQKEVTPMDDGWEQADAPPFGVLKVK